MVVRGPVPVREALVAGPQQAARMKRKIADPFNSLNGLLMSDSVSETSHVVSAVFTE